MRDFQPSGQYADCVMIPSPGDWKRTMKVGVRSDTFQQYAGRVIGTVIAQYYGIIQQPPGLLAAQHAFKGLNRKLLDEEDTEAEEKIVVYSWRPLADYTWSGSPHEGMPVRVVPPPIGKVFVALVRVDPPDENGIEGSIRRWNWVRQDPRLPGAPVEWGARYGIKLWSKQNA